MATSDMPGPPGPTMTRPLVEIETDVQTQASFHASSGIPQDGGVVGTHGELPRIPNSKPGVDVHAQGMVQTQQPVEEEPVKFVLLAEFDIDQGATLTHQYPFPTGTDEQ